jgi:cell division septal protein FtsQ
MRSAVPRRAALLDPRARAARQVDVATRARLIARQRPPRRHALRTLARALATTLAVATGLAAGGVAGAAGVRFVRTSPLFRIGEVEIAGAGLVPEAAVRAALAAVPGTSLFDVDPAAVRARVLALPGVLRAAVVRQLPNRLTVVVEERSPYALVHVSDPSRLGFRWVDETGRLVAKEGRGEVLDRPVLSGVEPPPGGDAGPLPDRLRTGLALLRALERAGSATLARISEIDLRRANEPILYTMDGVELRLGDGPWEARLARLDGLLDELQSSGERVDWIDLRFRNQVVFKPRPVAPPADPAAAPKTAARTGGAGSGAGDGGSDGRRP